MTRALRGACAAVLVLVGLLLVPFGNLGIWVQREVLDSDRFTALALDVVEEPAVRRALSARIVDELVAAEPRLDVARVVLEPGVAELLRTDAFQAVFSTTVAGMHTELEEGADALTLDLDPILPLVRTEVARIDAGVAERIPDGDALPSITVLSRDDAPQLWEGVQLTREASWAFPVLMVVVLVGAVAVANERARLLVVIGVAVALLSFVQVLVVRLGRDALSDVAGPNVSQGAFDRGYEVVTSTFVGQTIVLGVIALVVAGAGVALLLRSPRPSSVVAPT